MTDSAAVWMALTPFLIIVWLVQRIPGLGGTAGLLLGLTVGAAVVLSEWFGQRLTFWSASLNAGLSIVMAVLVAVAICQRSRRVKILRAQEWTSAWIFGAAASLFLYPSALGLGWRSFDSYALGWPWLDWGMSFLLFGAVAAIAGLLVWRGNRFGWILAFAAVLYALRVQESQNFWDYVIDPLYAVVSLLVLSVSAWRRLRRC